MITERSTSRGPQQMVWASIYIDSRGRTQRSPLVIMQRDANAAHNGYTADSYIDALEEGLLPSYRPGERFMMDNTRVHTAKRTAEFLESHGVWTIDFPPYSPDLNPIEHVWWALKRLLHKDYPHLSTRGRSQDEWEQFCEALKDCWARIPTKQIRKLIMSMPRRIQACVRARGYQTKY
jgi:transposase